MWGEVTWEMTHEVRFRHIPRRNSLCIFTPFHAIAARFKKAASCTCNDLPYRFQHTESPFLRNAYRRAGKKQKKSEAKHCFTSSKKCLRTFSIVLLYYTSADRLSITSLKNSYTPVIFPFPLKYSP